MSISYKNVSKHYILESIFVIDKNHKHKLITTFKENILFYK